MTTHGKEHAYSVKQNYLQNQFFQAIFSSSQPMKKIRALKVDMLPQQVRIIGLVSKVTHIN